jgi:integrase
MARQRSDPRRRKLDALFVKNVQPDDKRTLYWDTLQKGLALQVTPAGAKTYKLIYRFHGRPRWYTIGSVDAIGLKEAREIARDKMADVVKGTDVQTERATARKAGTFGDLAQRYIEEHAKLKLKSWRQSDYKIRAYLLPRWRNLNVVAITRADVQARINHITNNGSPIAANQALAQAGAIFAWAIKKGVVDLPANPAHGIERNATHRRERVLSEAELPLLCQAFDDVDPVRASALRLILLTGQRPGELQHMCWEHIDIGEHRLTDDNGTTYTVSGGWWSLPGAPDTATGWPGTKNGQSHRVWLSDPARAILVELESDNRSGFVFGGSRGKSIGGLDAVMRELSVRLGFKDTVRPHDLRRTHGTMITGLGFTRDQMNRIQNHKDGGIASVYDRHSYAHEARVIQEAVRSRFLALYTSNKNNSSRLPTNKFWQKRIT